jgi:hypothetical protein
MSTTAPEYLTALRDGFADAVQQWVDQSTTAWDQWSQAWAPVADAAGLGMPRAPGDAPGRRSRGGPDHGHGHDHRRSHEHRHEHRLGDQGCGCGGSGGCREAGHDHAMQGRHSHDHDCGHHGQHDHQGCGCHDQCGCGDVCDCCVPAADVIVRARAGEVRVVPFTLHNPWRREREVTLEVGPWHGCDGDDLVIRAFLEEQKVVLAPCEDRVVRLLISTRGTGDDGSTSTRVVPDLGAQDAPADTKAKPTRAAAAAAREPEDVPVGTGGRLTDVDACVSAYADVRFEGCARPQRVAVVVLPAECDAVDVGCDCGCCC